jgi:ectoine hydroxylase-related dioxygenase (phytanoyl-CoA dioxygenase family)
VQAVAQVGDKQQRIDDYSSIFTQVTNLWRVRPDTQQFILSQKFASIASQLLGVSHVRLYHDQALVKGPSAKKTPWHQDHFYWPIDSPQTVTMWIPLHSCPHEMGTMQFVKGSHLNTDIKSMPICEESEGYFQEYIEEHKLEVESYDLELGDATFHFGRTLHCAFPNTTATNREAMTIIYMADGVQAVKEDNLNEFRKVDLRVFCPGVKCSAAIDSPLNPLLF